MPCKRVTYVFLTPKRDPTFEANLHSYLLTPHNLSRVPLPPQLRGKNSLYVFGEGGIVGEPLTMRGFW